MFTILSRIILRYISINFQDNSNKYFIRILQIMNQNICLKLTVQAILPRGEDESNKTNVQITTTYVTAIPLKQTETLIFLYFAFICRGGVVCLSRFYEFISYQIFYRIMDQIVYNILPKGLTFELQRNQFQGSFITKVMRK